MRQVFRSAGLVVWLVGVMAGQTATVENAAVSNGLLSGFGYISYAPPVAILRLALAAQNVVSPGMLAALYVPSATMSMKIWIRPTGSNTPIRVEVVSSTSGQTTFVVPRNMPLGGAEIEYQAAEQPTGWTNVNVIAASFEFFRIGQRGPAIALPPR